MKVQKPHRLKKKIRAETHPLIVIQRPLKIPCNNLRPRTASYRYVYLYIACVYHVSSPPPLALFGVIAGVYALSMARGAYIDRGANAGLGVPLR